ncbi:MAG: FliM/FliN family flagellar motor switch protein [Thermodesulfobacteriota bacterium]
MEPILSQEEITELLQVIKSGSLSTDLESSGQPAVFKDATPVNLFEITKTQSGQSKIPNFDIVLDHFARDYSISLTNQLQRTFRVTRTGIESMVFHDLLVAQKSSGAIGVLNLNPLKLGALMVYSKELSYSLVETMLGASSELDPLQLERPLTTIELNILKTALDCGCRDIDQAFSALTEINSSLVKIEANTRMVSITDSDSEVIIGHFLIESGELSGTMSLVFPLAILEPLREKFVQLLQVSTIQANPWVPILENEVNEMSTTVIAQSGTLTLSVKDLINLKAGDILPLNYDPNSPLKVLVEENVKFFAIPGTHNGKKAISLTGIYE